jgi:hypothetical protein
MVQQVAKKTADIAGDGTTSATILADAIFRNGLRHVTVGANPVMVQRVDIVSTHLGDLRQSILNTFDNQGDLDGNARAWMLPGATQLDQQELIASLLQWPRIEAMPPSAFRNDQMLMMHGLAQGVVSFQVEWMFEEGVGRTTSIDGVEHSGYEYANNYSQPWWGGSMREDTDDPTSPIFFQTLSDYHAGSISTNDWNTGNYDSDVDSVASEAVWPSMIERQFAQGEGPADALIPVVHDTTVGINEYWSIFGYNGTNPLMEIPDYSFDPPRYFINEDLWSGFAWRYTPRPSALRITMRLLDRENRLGVGWTYQFIVDLPEAIK